MKKCFALLLALVMALSLAACGGGGEETPPGSEEDPPVGGQQQEQNTPDPGEDEPDDTPEVSVPDGVEIPVDKYPFLESLVLPDDAVVTEVDDSWYEEDGIIDMIVKPMDADKVAAYLEKLETAGYTEAEVSGLVSPDYRFEMSVGDMWIDMGYINLTIYDTNSDGGNSLTGLADLEIADGPELPEEVAKYVGTFDYAYSEGSNLVKVGLRNADDDAFERLIGYYALSGTLDEENSTSSEKIYLFDWGSVRATHFGVDEEIALEITIH
ncbi:MAG: hypothetical protein IJC43_04400 [Clostridia bacterium]|nr:hypothetical protein [Clostridia bacterium]